MDKAERFRRLTCNKQVNAELRTRSIRAAAFTGSVSMADFVVRMGSTAILARLIMPEHFGLVMMVMAIVAIADQLRELGLSAATVQRKEISHEEVTNLFWVNILAGLLIAVFVCALSPLLAHYFKEPRLALITCILSTNFLFGGLMVQHQALLTRQLKMGSTSLVRLFSSVVSTLLAIFLAWLDFGYWALVWREISRGALLAGGMWFCLPWIPGLPSRKTDIRGLIGFGTNLTGANIIGSISAGIDRFLIGSFWGPGPVAMYRQAYQLMIAPMDQLLSPVYQVAQPSLSMLQTDPERFRRFYKRVLTIACSWTMPASLFVAVYSTEVTRLFLGEKWDAAAPILFILSFGAFIKQPVGSAAQILISRGQSKTYLGLSVLQNVTMICFMCIGVRWGIQGVAVADVAATYFLIGPKLYYSLKNSPITVHSFFANITRPAMASVVMAAALLLVQHFGASWSMEGRVGLGLVLAPLAFFGAWMLIPGGKAELVSLVVDLRAALTQRTIKSKTPIAPRTVNSETTVPASASISAR